jgi:hypothetical protein
MFRAIAIASTMMLATSLGAADASAAATTAVASAPTDPRALLGRPDHDNDLAIEAFHWLASPQELHGIIRVRHVGKGPVGLTDRWNSWGAFQWNIVIGGIHVLSNPQHEWTENFFTETVIADGGTWAVAYSGSVTEDPVQAPWTFSHKASWLDPITADHPVLPHWTAITAPMPIQIVLDGENAESSEKWDAFLEKTSHLRPQRPPQYRGRLCVTSKSVGGADELGKLLLGPDGKALRTLQ